MTLKRRLGLLAAVVTAGVAVVSALELVGREARLVDVLVLFFSSLGAGASLVTAIRGGRRPASRSFPTEVGSIPARRDEKESP